MIETITIITLCVLYLVFFRPGKTPPLNNPLIIERPNQYHMTLAPQINLAQPFIEAIAKNIGDLSDTINHSSTQYFEVRDKQVTAHGFDSYLLAVTQCNGMLYFQATSPQSNDQSSYLRVIKEFADAVINRLHVNDEHDIALDERIVLATQDVAKLRGIQITLLRQD